MDAASSDEAEGESQLLSIPKTALQSLIDALQQVGYSVIAPTIDQEAIIYAEIQSAAELPVGWRDAQEPGKYRLKRSDEDSYFGFNVGPHAWKQFLFPPRLTVGTAQRGQEGWEFTNQRRSATKIRTVGGPRV